MGLTTAAVPAPNISFSVPSLDASTSSETRTGRTSTIPSFLATSIILFLVIPSRILSLTGAVNKCHLF
jgi:hypothetical protein